MFKMRRLGSGGTAAQIFSLRVRRLMNVLLRSRAVVGDIRGDFSWARPGRCTAGRFLVARNITI